MKKCKKCGALQNDDRSVCLDCGSVLGRPMSESEEAAATEAIDDKLEAMAERTEDFFVPLRDRIMGVICIIGIIAAFVLMGIAGGEKAELKKELNAMSPFNGEIIAGHYITDNGTSHITFSDNYGAYWSHNRQIEKLNDVALVAFCSMISLIGACPLLLFPRLIWRISTFKYRFFYDWDTTPSDFALIARKIVAYALFSIGMIALIGGWIYYL